MAKQPDRLFVKTTPEIHQKLHEAAAAVGLCFSDWARMILIEEAKAMGIDVNAKTPGISVRGRKRKA